jgi:hypothetical protein
MRRWLVLLAGVALMAVAGTAFAMNRSEEPVEHVKATEPTAEVEMTTTTIDVPVEPEPISARLPREEEVEKPGNDEVEKPGNVVRDFVDETPPSVVILHPEDGQVFEHEEVVIEGTTEAGARVFAGDHEAEVSEDGSWRIVLHLSRGENLLTVKAIDSSGNHATDTVTVVYRAPEKPKATEPKEEPNEEPKKEPKDHEVAEWEFSAHQLYGECSEIPPYDVFHGTGKPGSVIKVESEFGSGTAEIGDKGGWEIKVIFESAPVGEAFPVKVRDQFDHYQVFEFIRTG